MTAIDAQIATSCQAAYCEKRDFPKIANPATSHRMEVLDPTWLRARLKAQRGLSAQLARAMGVEPHIVSKITSGERRIQASEIPAILRFFADLDRAPQPILPAQDLGFAEAAVAPFRLPSNHLMHEMVRLIAPATRGATFYRVFRPQSALGLLRGDILIVDLGGAAQLDDIVIVTHLDPVTGDAETELARFAPPWLISGDSTRPSVALDPAEQSAAILGIVRGMVRAPHIT